MITFLDKYIDGSANFQEIVSDMKHKRILHHSAFALGTLLSLLEFAFLDGPFNVGI